MFFLPHLTRLLQKDEEEDEEEEQSDEAELQTSLLYFFYFNSSHSFRSPLSHSRSRRVVIALRCLTLSHRSAEELTSGYLWVMAFPRSPPLQSVKG